MTDNNAAPGTPMDLFSAIEQRFGPEALNYCGYYKRCTHLRLELCGGKSYIQKFARAFDRLRTLTDDVFGAEEDLFAVVRMFPGELPGGRKSPTRAIHKALRRVGFESAPEVARRRRRFPYGDSPLCSERIYLVSPRGPALLGLLWAVCADELGVLPDCPLDLYLLDRALTIVVHPYDDRGVDIASPDIERLRPHWRRRQAWMLAYNLPEMTATFGPP